VKRHLQSPDTVIVRPATTTLTMSKFLELALSSAEDLAVASREQRLNKPAYYLEYLQLNQYIPDLLDDATVPSFAKFLKKTHHNLWVGTGTSKDEQGVLRGTVGKLHFDP